MPSETSNDVARSQEAAKIVNRLKRARGQLDAVISAIESGAPCDEVITQLSAAHGAVRKTAFIVVAAAMRECTITPQRSEEDLKRLEKLFLSLA